MPPQCRCRQTTTITQRPRHMAGRPHARIDTPTADRAEPPAASHAHARTCTRKSPDKPRQGKPAPARLASVQTSTHTRVPHDCRWPGVACVGVDRPPYPPTPSKIDILPCSRRCFSFVFVCFRYAFMSFRFCFASFRNLLFVFSPLLS